MRKTKGRTAFDSALRNPKSAIKSGFRLGLAQTGDLIAGFALAALFQKRRALEAFEDIAFTAKGGRGAETTML